MNYQDMLKLAKGDQLNVYMSDGWTTGEVVRTQGGAEPTIWLSTVDGVFQVHTGANFTESAWYQLRVNSKFQFADEDREQASNDARHTV